MSSFQADHRSRVVAGTGTGPGTGSGTGAGRRSDAGAPGRGRFTDEELLATAPLPAAALGAFSARGIELEWMIVDRDTLDPLPVADYVLRDDAGLPVSDVNRGLMGWSNELVMHVIEVKNLQPAATLAQLAPAFQREVRYLNHLLEHFHARLMPTAMHPWMNPAQQTKIWPHQHAQLYQTYARLFDCNTHGWANLQSMHLNLPFRDDGEFTRLHAAVRLILPLLPALAASSPIADGRPQAALDYRMQVYTSNADEFPTIAGLIVPEDAGNQAEYEQNILEPMYRAIAPFDPQAMLQHEWLNSRGAIARFDRNAIEIRVLDTQECPLADLAVAGAVTQMIRHLYFFGPALPLQRAIPTKSLATILQDCVRDADEACIDNDEYLTLLGYAGSHCSAGELLRFLIPAARRSAPRSDAMPADISDALQTLLTQGPLSRRILRALDGDHSPARLQMVYRELCDCLQRGQLFAAPT